MATSKQQDDIEQSENRVNEDHIRAPLITQTNTRVTEAKRQDRCMVYLSTFVAVYGSFTFGSCVSPAFSLIHSSFPNSKLLHLQVQPSFVIFLNSQVGYSSPTQSAIRKILIYL